MNWRRHMQALLCAVLLLATAITVAFKTFAPVTASGSTPSDQPSFSIKAKNRATSFEIETSDAGSIETRDSGSLWDDEVPAYDLTTLSAR